MRLSKLLAKHSVVGLIGNRSTAKTSLMLCKLKELREDCPKLKIAAMGINSSLNPVLKKYNISTIMSKMDILDLQIKDTIIFVDEFALMFDTRNKNKEQDKLMRFFDRIEHQNCKIIIGTAREGYFNKFMCSRITLFISKEIEYDGLVNGTWLKERVKAITSRSDYRLECEKKDYFIISTVDSITEKGDFKYNPEFDSKKDNVNLFEIAKPKKKREPKKAKLRGAKK